MAEEKKRVEQPVVNGKVNMQKSLGARIHDDLELEDNHEVAKYIWKDLLIPKLKDLFYELATGSLEKKMYGTTSGGRRGGPRRNESASYTRYYKSDSRPSHRDDDSSSDSRLDYKDILLYERADAEQILSTLCDLIDTYHEASIGDLYDAAGITPDDNFTTNTQYGWTNLSSATVRRVKDGYILDLPRPKFLG